MIFRSLQYYLDRLNPEMVTYARELRGITKKELSELIGKTPAALTRIEQGSLRPELDTFFTLARVLRVEPYFLARNSASFPAFDYSKIHFRGQRKVSATQKRMLIREGEAVCDLLDCFSTHGILYPDDSVREFSTVISNDFDIEKLALDVRNNLGLGFGPIDNLIGALEAAGIFVVFLQNRHDIVVDAFSTIYSNRPCIVICSYDSYSRVLFSIAHELGHLLIHEYTDGGMQQEREANRFAGSFLLPWKTFKEDCPKCFSITAFMQMKKRWKIAISAMLYRAKQLSIYSDSTYIRAIQYMRSKNMIVTEPCEAEFLGPKMFEEALRLLVNKGLRISTISHELGQPKTKIIDMLKNQCVDDGLLEQFVRDSKQIVSPLLQFTPPQKIKE